MKRKGFYLAEVSNLDDPKYKKFVSRTTSEGRVLSTQNTEEYAERWALVIAVNMAEARKKFNDGDCRWIS